MSETLWHDLTFQMIFCSLFGLDVLKVIGHDDPTCVPILIDLVSDDFEEVRILAIEALVPHAKQEEAAKKKITATLERALVNPSAKTRDSAREALRSIEEK